MELVKGKKKKLTTGYVDSLPLCEVGQKFYRDTELKGFGVRVGKSNKAYFVEKRVNRKNVRVIIGNTGLFSSEEARKMALKKLGDMANGINPIEAEKEKLAKSVTLEDAFKEYVKVRSLKASTIRNMKYVQKQIFSDWQKKSLNEITRDMVQKRHKKIAGESGKYHADNSMRDLRTIFNFAIPQYRKNDEESLIRNNPVDVLSDTKSWHKRKRRQTIIEPSDLSTWFKAVTAPECTDRAETVRDYLLLVILTGLRRNEAAKLKWSDINLFARKLTIEETKNGNSHSLPLSDFLVKLLADRKSKATSIFVFPGENKDGYLKEPKRQIQIIRESSGVKFTIHDLRRNFITAAHQLVPFYSAKRLANHAISASDVTDGYNVLGVDALREPMQKITDYFLEKGQVDKNTMTSYEIVKDEKKAA